ncbi:hypothetical protein VIAQ111709_13410 [Vibrio aquimaris]|uniref:Uncharacterized protein n=1 Tax=Vibrio aquimaris TaxID=2587862 RepID=A0A5P9CP06_9VIBR|nr:hypothetical protein FIV01_16265 [Vibrio aquimaris]
MQNCCIYVRKMSDGFYIFVNYAILMNDKDNLIVIKATQFFARITNFLAKECSSGSIRYMR